MQKLIWMISILIAIALPIYAIEFAEHVTEALVPRTDAEKIVGSPAFWARAKRIVDAAIKQKEAIRQAQKLARQLPQPPLVLTPAIFTEAEKQAMQELEKQRIEYALINSNFYQQHPANIPLTNQASPLSAIPDEVKLPLIFNNITVAKDPIEAGTLIRRLGSTNLAWDSLINGSKETNQLVQLMQKKWDINRTEALLALSTPRAARTLFDELYDDDTLPDRQNELQSTLKNIDQKIQESRTLTSLEQRIVKIEPFLLKWINFVSRQTYTPKNPITYLLWNYHKITPEFSNALQFALLAGFSPLESTLKDMVTHLFAKDTLQYLLEQKAIPFYEIENLYQYALKVNPSTFNKEQSEIFHQILQMLNKYRPYH